MTWTLQSKTLGPRRLKTRVEIRDAGIAVAEQARRELILFGRTVEPDLYDVQRFFDAVRRLALARRDVPIRLLLADPRTSHQTGQRLTGLAQHLTSRVAIRRLGDDFLERPDAFLIGDETAYVRRALADASEGIADLQGRREARRLRSEFEHMWEHSDVDPELRRLYL